MKVSVDKSGIGLSALVLTATLRPSAAVHELRRANWDLRENDYLLSAQSWSSAGRSMWDQICLVDNSPEMTSDQWMAFSAKLENNSSGLVEPIRVRCTGDLQGGPIQKGRGEAQLLDLAAVELAERGVTYFSKVTGRLFVSNIEQVVKGQQRDGISASISSRLDMSDTRFFSMPVQVWIDHYRDMAGEIDETGGVIMERVFARRTLTAIAKGVPFYGIRRIPRFRGSSASMNIDYGSMRTRLNQTLHEVARTPIRRRHAGLIL